MAVVDYRLVVDGHVVPLRLEPVTVRTPAAEAVPVAVRVAAAVVCHRPGSNQSLAAGERGRATRDRHATTSTRAGSHFAL